MSFLQFMATFIFVSGLGIFALAILLLFWKPKGDNDER